MDAKLPSAPRPEAVHATVVHALVDDALADFLRQHDLAKYLAVFQACEPRSTLFVSSCHRPRLRMMARNLRLTLTRRSCRGTARTSASPPS